MEHKVYNQEPITDKDKLVTEELKKFSRQEMPGPSSVRDHEEEVMLRASAEIERRTKKYMLFNNLPYFEASTRVVQSDKELASLWTHGRILE